MSLDLARSAESPLVCNHHRTSLNPWMVEWVAVAIVVEVVKMVPLLT